MSDEKERDLIQQLKNMPNIKDTRNKDDLFDHILKEVEKETEPRRKKFNVIPYFVAASALFLVMLVPFLLDNNSNEMSDRMTNQENSYMDAEGSNTFSDSDSDEAQEGTFDIASEEEENTLYSMPDLVVETLDSDSSMVKLFISDEAFNYMIPLSLIVPADVKEIAFQDQLEQYLTDFQNYNLNLVSAEPTDIAHELGNTNITNELSTTPASYLLFNNQYFMKVTQENSITINDAIAALKTDIPEMNASHTIPNHINFNIKEANERLFVTLEEPQEVGHDEITTTMIESILLTAKSYGFETVKFENMPIESIEHYSFEEAIEVPIGVNPIYY